MFPVNNQRYFFIITKLNLFPEIKPNTINMIEQAMNAILLLNENNIQRGINKVLELEYFCQPFLNESYEIVLEKIIPLLKELNISVVQGEQVRLFYATYNDNNKFYDEVGKQAPINLEFSLLKKISYNGKNIIWEDTFAFWLNAIMMDREEHTQHKPDDTLINTHIFQKVEDLRYAIRDVILNETQRYAEQYQQHLQNAQTASVQ